MKNDFDSSPWERTAIQELYREYRAILRDHRVDLRPAAITLFDSDTHWGRWDPLTRTISLSRTLIQSHPWFQAIAILRHEMAHQWVDENYASHPIRETPHGERFHEACRKLGVPAQFSKASAQLKENALDWREEKRDGTAEKLLDKVRKLLALAASSNEHEAVLAMNKVREIYAKHNLEQASSHSSSDASNTPFAHIVITHRKKRIEAHQTKIVGILVGHFFVQVISFNQFDLVTGERYKSLEIIGTRENALMAEYVYHFLLQQTESRVLAEVKRRGDGSLSRLDRKSFRMGILTGFAEKLRQSEKEMKTAMDRHMESAVGESNRASHPRAGGNAFETGKGALAKAELSGTELSLIGQAIVKFKKDPHLANYIAEVYPRLTNRGNTTYGINVDAFAAGREIGKNLTLNKPIETRAGNLGRLLQ